MRYTLSLLLFSIASSLVPVSVLAMPRRESIPIQLTPIQSTNPSDLANKNLANNDLASNNLANNTVDQQAQQLYETGQFDAAIALLNQLVETATTQGNNLARGMALRNLALVYQATGQLSEASATISASLEELQPLDRSLEIAQALEVKGQIELKLGQAETALDTWKMATNLYRESSDISGLTRSQINQAQALKSLGLYRQAIEQLTIASTFLETQPNTLIKANVLQSLGDAFRVIGNLDKSQELLQQSLTIAEQLSAGDAIAAASIGLGNTLRSQQKLSEASNLYKRAAEVAQSESIAVQAQLNQLSASIDQNRLEIAQTLVSEIQSKLEELPWTQTTAYASINLAENLAKIQQKWPESGNHDRQAAELLANAIQQAEILGDNRTRSYALGNLGHIYERQEKWADAQQLTEQALMLAQANRAADIAYQWQWQLGRILQVNGDRTGAILAYSQAVETLKVIRGDLVAISSEAQFSFRERVEPVYREFVSLLLEPGKEVSQDDLKTARKTIEALQLAELDNFFRDACLDAKPAQIDSVDPKAAVIYPIILSDRLEVIAALPGQPLRNYSTPLTKAEIEATISDAIKGLTSPRLRGDLNNFLTPSKAAYNWLIRPIEADLAQSEVETLVFVLDGLLRRLPMSALSDGNDYLIQKYAVALTPGLQLLDTQSIASEDFQVFAGGLSEARQGFSALPGVLSELTQIEKTVPAQDLVNLDFTETNVRNLLNSSTFPIIHLATHGEFSSKAEDTFVLTWDDRINASELENLLRRDSKHEDAIELLVLSACRTAAGDDRAALGLAGVAVRAGAKSTVASLWYISDAATSVLMTQFYTELSKQTETKAESLRRAQEAVLQNDRFSHPYFWAAFVLVGNWL
jgi:CHAT domain-containing protein